MSAVAPSPARVTTLIFLFFILYAAASPADTADWAPKAESTIGTLKELEGNIPWNTETHPAGETRTIFSPRTLRIHLVASSAPHPAQAALPLRSRSSSERFLIVIK